MSVAIVAAARASSGNGRLTMGFVGSADPGLPRAKWIRIPHASKTQKFNVVPRNTDKPSVADLFAECIFTDAEIVAAENFPEPLRAFASANRAYAFAYGYVTKEAQVAGAALTDSVRDTIATNFPFVKDAADMKPDTGTLATLLCSLNYWASNHNTTGICLPKGQIKIIRNVLSLPESVTDMQITDSAYFGGHGSDKRLTLRSILPSAEVSRLSTPDVYSPCVIASMDAWASKRTTGSLLPAGTAVVGLLKVFLGHVARCGLLGFAPAPQAVLTLEAAAKALETNPGNFHPGAQYLFGVDVDTLSMIEDLKQYVAIFGGFCMAARLAPSAWSPAHVQTLIGERGDVQWNNIGKRFAKGVEISEEAVKAAAGKFGAVVHTNIPDPSSDADGYKRETSKFVTTLNGVNV